MTAASACLKPPLCFAALLMVGLTGCKIQFEGQTIVEPDGSVTRTSRYIADDEQRRDDLQTRYTLPEGGTWSTQTQPQPDGRETTTYIYEVTRHFEPGQEIASDYIRYGVVPDHIARNDITIHVHQGWLATSYHYVERFRDAATRESAERAARRISAAWVEFFAAQLEARLQEAVSAAQARHALNEYLSPPLEQGIDGVRRQGAAFFDTPQFKEKIQPAFDKDHILDALLAAFDPRVPAMAPTWRALMAQAYDDMDQLSMTEPALLEELLGVHGLVASVELTQTVQLPGHIVSTNAASRQGNRATWKWQAVDFLWDEYRLEARSRVLRGSRVTGIGLVLLLGAGLVVGLRKPRRKPS